MSSYVDHVDTHNLVQVYLMSCYLYEHKHLQVLDDDEFDAVCQWLDEEWDDIDHVHKHIIDREALSTSTASYLREDDFPNMVKGAAMAWYSEFGTGTPPQEDTLPLMVECLEKLYKRLEKAHKTEKGCKLSKDEASLLFISRH